ncbi:hypothetical protein CCO03_08460 [Comamonas serinivorans]|uniref:Uncharacterized protein n=1 Tax=Comamonas serinivorans TaxID=1082851 RepID=A0A1Y0EML8_9BURK|nr:hypothetical protein [Comamonas serinivorans]ARU04701.1 hypothetical protein CCO03_08460 [Comamonas serinivorans]
MTDAHKDFEAAFGRYLDAVGPVDAISTATAIFVGLIVSLAESKGADMSLPIQVKGGEQRDITIHPPNGEKEQPQ